MDIVQPFTSIINPVADTGANINVIGPKIAMKYKYYLKQDRKEQNIRTANGDVTIKQYLPIHFKNGSKIVKPNFMLCGIYHMIGSLVDPQYIH